MPITKIEVKTLQFIKKHVVFFYIVVISILAALIRKPMIEYTTFDMDVFLLPWFDEIKLNGGLSGLANQVGNYNILYQTIIAIMTYIPMRPIIMYKLLSGFFDYVLAASTAALAYKINKKSKLVFPVVYTLILLMPTVVINSSLWGQCDAMYVSFVVISLMLLFNERYTGSFIVLGIAFAFKLQFMFIVPLYIYYYFGKKKFSAVNFLLLPLTGWVSSIPALIMGRRPVWSFFSIYMSQTGEYTDMTMKCPNIWAILQGDYWYTRGMAIGMTIGILGIALLIIIVKKVDFCDNEFVMLLACWSVWTCVEFLPCMHERYTFMLDILLLILAFKNIKKYSFFFLLEGMSSLITYADAMFEKTPDYGVLACIYFAGYCLLTYKLLNQYVLVKEK
jgi:Gpi18-like mannosyltransferase